MCPRYKTIHKGISRTDSPDPRQVMRVVRETSWIGVRDVFTEGRYQCAAGGMLNSFNNFASKSNSVSRRHFKHWVPGYQVFLTAKSRSISPYLNTLGSFA